MIRSNASKVIKVLIQNINGVEADVVARACATAVLPEMKQRIHVEGKDSKGGQIGTYSNAYMKVRTGNFTNSGRKSKGANKGALKDSGTYTKGNAAATARPKYNRTADTKVVLSLTRQMENDMGVVAAGKSYGIGFKNKLNYDKSIWCEETYNKDIYKLTPQELELVRTTAKGFIAQIKGQS